MDYLDTNARMMLEFLYDIVFDIRMMHHRIGCYTMEWDQIRKVLMEPGSMLMINSEYTIRWCLELIITYFKRHLMNQMKIDNGMIWE